MDGSHVCRFRRRPLVVRSSLPYFEFHSEVFGTSHRHLIFPKANAMHVPPPPLLPVERTILNFPPMPTSSIFVQTTSDSSLSRVSAASATTPVPLHSSYSPSSDSLNFRCPPRLPSNPTSNHPQCHPMMLLSRIFAFAFRVSLSVLSHVLHILHRFIYRRR